MNENNFNDELNTYPLFDSLRAFAATPVAPDTFGLNNALEMFNKKARKPFRRLLKVSVPLIVVSFGIPSLAYAGVLPDAVSHPIEGFVRTVVTHPALAVAHSLSTIVSPSKPTDVATASAKPSDSPTGSSDESGVAGVSGEANGNGDQGKGDNQSSDNGAIVNGNVTVGVGKDGNSSQSKDGQDNNPLTITGRSSDGNASDSNKPKNDNSKENNKSKEDKGHSNATPSPTLSGIPSIGGSGSGDDSESDNGGASTLPPLSVNGVQPTLSPTPTVQGSNEND